MARPHVALLIVLALSASCVVHPQGGATPTPWARQNDGALEDRNPSAPERTRTRNKAPLPLKAHRGQPKRYDTQRLGPKTSSSPSRPRPVGPRDIRLSASRLDNACRLLAEVGRFDLVVDRPLPQTVSLNLQSVEPYDALLAIARSQGLLVRYSKGFVYVSPAEKEVKR